MNSVLPIPITVRVTPNSKFVTGHLPPFFSLPRNFAFRKPLCLVCCRYNPKVPFEAFLPPLDLLLSLPKGGELSPASAGKNRLGIEFFLGSSNPARSKGLDLHIAPLALRPAISAGE